MNSPLTFNDSESIYSNLSNRFMKAPTSVKETHNHHDDCPSLGQFKLWDDVSTESDIENPENELTFHKQAKQDSAPISAFRC